MLETVDPSQYPGALRALDDLAWRLERLWLLTWLDLPVASRPACILIRPDGAVPLGLELPVDVRFAVIGVLAGLGIFSALQLLDALAAADGPTLSNVERSRLLTRLAAQGVVYRTVREGPVVDRASRPLRRYTSLVAIAERRVRKDRTNLGEYPLPEEPADEDDTDAWEAYDEVLFGDPVRIPPPRFVAERLPAALEEDPRAPARNFARAIRLATRLRERGLLTV
jgi:hypothetical protein